MPAGPLSPSSPEEALWPYSEVIGALPAGRAEKRPGRRVRSLGDGGVPAAHEDRGDRADVRVKGRGLRGVAVLLQLFLVYFYHFHREGVKWESRRGDRR